MKEPAGCVCSRSSCAGLPPDHEPRQVRIREVYFAGAGTQQTKRIEERIET